MPRPHSTTAPNQYIMPTTPNYNSILSHFLTEGTVADVKPLGNGLINDTLMVTTKGDSCPDYVLQRINDSVFTDVELLQHNITTVTDHIRRKLADRGETDLDRRVLRFVKTHEGKSYLHDEDGRYWRLSVFIPRSQTLERVTPRTSLEAGRAFGEFESMLADLKEPLGETIPGFHNMELKARMLREAVDNNLAQRVGQPEVRELLRDMEADMEEMCKAERLYREGQLPKRICHCDTKVNNMLYDAETGNPLCVIDLDTVMPSFVFSDFGDFLRTAANFVAEDCPDLNRVGFNMDIFRSFAQGYLESTRQFLLPIERDNLPFATALFPFMQSVRFLWDYLNGDKYWKVEYPTHNLVRAQNQMALYKSVRLHEKEMTEFLRNCQQ